MYKPPKDLKLFHSDILIPNLSFPAAMHLQPDQSKLGNLVIRLGIIDHFHSVDERANPFSLAMNFIIIPVLLLNRLFNVVDVGFN